MNDYQNYIALSRYARWLPEEGRRETWEESVNRYIDYFIKASGASYDGGELIETFEKIHKSILNLEVMPSMRAMMCAGPALDRDNVAGYNCSYLTISRQRSFDEIMYILMNGTGVGFSVERQYISKLPIVSEEFHPTDTTIVVADSKIGWATALRELISLLYSGKAPKWDVSKVRPAGAPLKTFGGRASGPAPLEDLFRYATDLFSSARGRRLNSIECHGLVCKIAEVVVVGGVRRSACISLSNLSDDRMRHAKSGQWWENRSEYALANNSVCYTEKPSMDSFMREWLALMESKSGERGIFNREASAKQVAKNGRREPNDDWGTNPCSEIILRDRQFCNLSEVVVRSTDTFEDLKRKVRQAAILGTLQATRTKFRYLSKAWEDNTREEALLGISFTGIMDHPVMNGDCAEYELEDWLLELKEVAIETNKEWAEKLGINPAAAITCVKPSGTVSQLVDSASGIHTRHSPYYVRTIRADKKDPLAQLMVDQGFPVEDDVTKPDSTYVFSFPTKAPEGAICRNDRIAIEQLELWLVYQRHWCEHKPSVTISVRDEEWMVVGAWVWEHFDEVSGISFLPYSGHTYRQAPYQDITEEEYNEWLTKMPEEVRWEELGKYETSDLTEGAKEYACTAGQCEI